MKTSNILKNVPLLKRGVTMIFGAVIIMWAIFFIDTLFPADLTTMGVVPRTFKGLFGIPLQPFLHANMGHLLSNTVPFIILGLTTFFAYPKKAVSVFVISTIVGGIMLWIIGRSSYHIGASMIIYSLASFLIAAGIISKKIVPIIIAVLVSLIYGISMVFGVLPTASDISWEGHLSGAVGGIVSAFQLIPKSKNLRF